VTSAPGTTTYSIHPSENTRPSRVRGLCLLHEPHQAHLQAPAPAGRIARVLDGPTSSSTISPCGRLQLHHLVRHHCQRLRDGISRVMSWGVPDSTTSQGTAAMLACRSFSCSADSSSTGVHQDSFAESCIQRLFVCSARLRQCWSMQLESKAGASARPLNLPPYKPFAASQHQVKSRWEVLVDLLSCC